jgi:hypothetical protein
MDTTVRELERAAATGDERAALKLVRERARAVGKQPVHVVCHFDWCRVIDMTNAGKRGKKCRELSASDPCQGSRDVFARIEKAQSFDEALSIVLEAKASQLSSTFHVLQGEIRGVDAPKERLTAGNAGTWSASVDEDGVSVADHTDPFNEPRAITSGQSKAAAYSKAAKVWDRVQAARTFHEACSILRNAGVRLHSYCGMD